MINMWKFIREDLLAKSISFHKTQTIWPIKFSELIIEEILSNNLVILGGDVIDAHLKYTYDSWYWNYDEDKSYQENCEVSATIAQEYINKYVERNGNQFYIEFVILPQR